MRSFDCSVRSRGSLDQVGVRAPRSVILAAVLVALLPAIAAGDIPKLHECLDRKEYPTALSQAECLEYSDDVKAIPELHRMARTLAAAMKRAALSDRDFVQLGKFAGHIAESRRDRKYLMATARSKDVTDQAFALIALNESLEQPRGDDLRQVEAAARRGCEPLLRSTEPVVHAAAGKCMHLARKDRPRMLEGVDISGELKGGIGHMPWPPPPGTGGLGLKGKPTGERREREYMSCLRDAFAAGGEFCVNSRNATEMDTDVTVCAQQHPGPPGATASRWAPEPLGGDDHHLFAVTRLDLLAGEAFPGETPVVLGRSGQEWLIFAPIVRGEAAPYVGARAVLLTYDAAAQEFRPAWKSPACEKGCKEPSAEILDASDGKEVRVHLDSVQGALVLRLRWYEGRLYPKSN